MYRNSNLQRSIYDRICGNYVNGNVGSLGVYMFYVSQAKNLKELYPENRYKFMQISWDFTRNALVNTIFVVENL